MEPGANLENVAARMEAASLECTSLRTSAADKLLCDDEGLGSTGGNDGQQGYPAAGSLAEMTSEVLRSLVCFLEQKDMIRVGGTCRAFNELREDFTSGRQAFPLGATVDERYGNADNAVEVDADTGVCRKGVRPGIGTVLAKERLDKMTCYWEVAIRKFTGVRLYVGVATRRCISRGGLDKQQCWLFDCYGRVSHEAYLRGYGCKVQAGDVLGVLLNTAYKSLSFFLNGLCMGTAFRNVRGPQGAALYPLLLLPSVPHETVQFLRRPDREPSFFPASVWTMLASKRNWLHRKHPDDGSIIVETYDAQAIYRLAGMDPRCTTVGQLKEALVGCWGLELFTPDQLSLRTRGNFLVDDSVPLASVGVSFSSRGTQLQDIYLHVPHLIS